MEFDPYAITCDDDCWCKSYSDEGGTEMLNNEELLIIRDLCLSTYDSDRLSDFDYTLLNIADRIEKELGIE